MWTRNGGVLLVPALAMAAWTCSVVNAPDEPTSGVTSSGSGGTGTGGTTGGGGTTAGGGGTAPDCGDGMVDPSIGETCDPPSSCPDCDDQDPCTTDETSGSANQCNVVCTQTAITACTTEVDECCPQSCDGSTDIDCASCGNNTVELGETCDGDCPSGCDDNDPCTADSETGSAQDCDLECTNAAITTCVGGDSCCPSSCNPNNDADCAVPATCQDLLTNMSVWGQQATGLDLRPWTNSTLHWIGCCGEGCIPSEFYCNYDPNNQVLTFGSNGSSAVRALVDPSNAMGDTIPSSFATCCSANTPSDICNAPDNVDGPQNSVDALCDALGYQNGQQIDLVGSNSCPEPHALTADGLSWTSDFVSSPGYGKDWQCSGFK